MTVSDMIVHFAAICCKMMLSLPRSCPRIKFHMIEMLVHDLREQCSAITPFEVSFTEACCLLNDDATKTFVCAKVSQVVSAAEFGCPTAPGLCKSRSTSSTFLARTVTVCVLMQGHDNAVQLVHAVNRAFHLHGLPQYYEEVIPHVSVGCIQGRKDREGQHAVAALKQALSELDWKHDVREIALVIGKKRYAVHLGMKSTK